MFADGFLAFVEDFEGGRIVCTSQIYDQARRLYLWAHDNIIECKRAYYAFDASLGAQHTAIQVMVLGVGVLGAQLWFAIVS